MFSFIFQFSFFLKCVRACVCLYVYWNSLEALHVHIHTKILIAISWIAHCKPGIAELLQGYSQAGVALQ